MKKQIIRQVQQNGNRFEVCLAPEVREPLGIGRGDPLVFDVDVDNKRGVFRKVVPADPARDNSQADNRSNLENKPKDSKETSLAVRSKAVPVEPDETETKTGFCLNCGSDEIDVEVDGNRYYCHDCDVLYEFTGNGVKPIKLDHRASGMNDINSRLDQIEQNIQDIDERLSDEPDDEPGPLDWGWVRKPVVVMSGVVNNENGETGEAGETDEADEADDW